MPDIYKLTTLRVSSFNPMTYEVQCSFCHELIELDFLLLPIVWDRQRQRTRLYWHHKCPPYTDVGRFKSNWRPSNVVQYKAVVEKLQFWIAYNIMSIIMKKLKGPKCIDANLFPRLQSKYNIETDTSFHKMIAETYKIKGTFLHLHEVGKRPMPFHLELG